jgi:hypothetical protein
MISLRRPAAVVLLATGLLMSHAGCATTPPASERAQLGTIGVVLWQVAAKRVDVPAKGAGEGAARGAAAGRRVFSTTRLAIAFILMPLGAAFGAMGGAALADDAAKVEAAERTLVAAFTSFQPDVAVRDRFMEAARNHTRLPIVALPSAIETAGVGTILEIKVRQFHLQGKGPVNPPFVLVMNVRARLLRVGSLEEIREKSFTYESQGRAFLDWAAGNAWPLRDEFDRAAISLAKDMVVRMFPGDLSTNDIRP